MNALTENFRKCVSTVLASVVFFAPIPGSAQAWNTVVNIIAGWKIQRGWPYGQMLVAWRPAANGTQTVSVCNYSKLVDDQPGRTNYATARHCLFPLSSQKKFDFLENDLYVSEKLSDEVSGRRVVSSDSPRAYSASRYDSNTIIGRRLTLVGGLPNGKRNSSLGFSISGKAERIAEGVVGIRVPVGQLRQMWKTQWQDTIHGMSGSPAFDDEGNIFWVLSGGIFSKVEEYVVVYPLRK